MSRRSYIISVLIFWSTLLDAQSITQGPIVGGVTRTSAKMLMFLDTTVQAGVEISADSSFVDSRTFVALGDAANGNVVKFYIDSLTSDTRYFYRGFVDSTLTDIRTFQTFPCVGAADNYAFLFGSCLNNNFNDDELFVEALNHPARFFLQIGDWTYPDNTDNLPNNNDLFPADYNRVIDSYKNKYSYKYFTEYLKTVAVDYVWDDHDYANNNCSRNHSSYTNFSIPIQLLEIPFPPGTRRNAIKGYYDLFPGYAPVDSSEGIFHKFRFGNIEVFMLDNRAARSPTTLALQASGGQVSFVPPPGHTIIGDVQRQWLLDGLRNSTATWKFITTATAFNQTYGDALNAVIQLPQFAGMPLAATIIDSWSGFPMDQDTLIHVVHNEGIDGVVMLSGDTHTAAMDNGQAGGLPEIMAGCLSQTNSTLLNTVPLQSFGLVWNEGGQGVGNLNTNDAFGKVTINGDDSITLELIDENGDLIADQTIYSCSYLTGLSLTTNTINDVQCYGDSSGSFSLTASGGTPPYRFTLDGKTYQSDSVFRGVPAGVYHPAVRDNNNCTKEVCMIIAQPEPLQVSYEKEDVSCFGLADGAVDLSVKGGVSPYQYNWSNGGSVQDLDSIFADTYLVTVTDSNNCVETVDVEIEQPDVLMASTNSADVSCYGKGDGVGIVVPAGGASPYQILWSNGKTVLSQYALAAGTYSFTLTDSNNCTLIDSITVTGPDTIQLNPSVVPDYSGDGSGSIKLHVTGGTPPYDYMWYNGSNTDSLGGLFPGVYPVEVTDLQGCKAEASITVPSSVNVEDGESIQLRIYPNPASHKIALDISLPFSTDFDLAVFNVLGERLLELHKKNFRQGQITLDISSLGPGAYFVGIQSSKISMFKKFSISK